MKRILITSMLLCITALGAFAQTERPFEGYLYNDELKIFLKFNLYDKDVIVPGQEVYGELDGYMGSKQCAHVWAITVARILSPTEAEVTLINNYGSEDLTAKIIRLADGTYEYRFIDGSTLKFPVKNKWQKIPKTVKLKRK